LGCREWAFRQGHTVLEKALSIQQSAISNQQTHIALRARTVEERPFRAA